MQEKPRLQLAVLSDYICPFCYIGYLRLEKLRQHYDLAVNWVLVEIHPESPAEGKPVEDLGYSKQQLDGMLGELDEMSALRRPPPRSWRDTRPGFPHSTGHFTCTDIPRADSSSAATQ